MRSDKTLRRWYLLINKKFFYGELPTNVTVRWALPGEEKDIACTDRKRDGRYCYEILLNRDKNKANSQKLSSLAHEMVHIATHYKDNHGPLFSEWHDRLVERGLFKKGALLKGISLF
jgi:predicted metallopeptidase